MEITALVDAACERAGADDLGDDSWREGLDVLVRSLTTEATLNEIGVAAMRDQIVGFLETRLRVEAWYAEHPEIDDQEVEAPLFGLGLPRTASTALGYLLAQDPARRSLRVWEAGAPCPPPTTATEHTDARIARAQAGIDVTNELFPDFAGMIPTDATGPQECLLLMALDFRSQIFEGMTQIPTYRSWLLGCELTSTYRYHKRVLKLLQWRCPPTSWSLRSPAHMHSIEALDAVYPDARFVMTHRDVASVLPSVCALYHSFSSVLAERSDPIGIGRSNMALWRESLERLLAFRDAGNEHRFHDILFADVQRDPIGTMQRLYAMLGDPLTDAARRRMEAWWAANAEQRGPAPQYEPERYGLDRAAIREQFAFYHDRFGIPVSQSAAPSAGDAGRAGA